MRPPVVISKRLFFRRQLTDSDQFVMRDQVMAIERNHEIPRRPAPAFRRAVFDAAEAAQADALGVSEVRYETGKSVRSAQPDVGFAVELEPQPHRHDPAIEHDSAAHVITFPSARFCAGDRLVAERARDLAPGVIGK